MIFIMLRKSNRLIFLSLTALETMSCDHRPVFLQRLRAPAAKRARLVMDRQIDKPTFDGDIAEYTGVIFSFVSLPKA